MQDNLIRACSRWVGEAIEVSAGRLGTVPEGVGPGGIYLMLTSAGRVGSGGASFETCVGLRDTQPSRLAARPYSTGASFLSLNNPI